jgi:hypothetical protein
MLGTANATKCISSRRHKHGDWPFLGKNSYWLFGLRSIQLNHQNNSLFEREFPLTSSVQIRKLLLISSCLCVEFTACARKANILAELYYN